VSKVEEKPKQREIFHAVALGLSEGIGPINAKKLIAHCGSAEAVFREKKQNLLRIPGIGEYTTKGIREDLMDRAHQEMEFIRKNKINIHYYQHADYPQRLKYCEDGPLVLFSLGKGNFNQQKSIAIVGTRNPTEYGKRFTEKLIADLKSYNVSIVSGLAYGIDICAHRACVKEKVPTFGVLAHGLDRIYPGIHRSVAEQMLEQGKLITEFMSQTNPDRENFPRRNRIVAGMTDATVVIETAVKGGSIITALLANDYSRDVFAAPGRAFDERSEGCNRLIKTNRAALLENAEDLIHAMGWGTGGKTAPVQTALFPEMDKEEEVVFGILKKNGPTPIDLLTLESGMSMSHVSGLLLRLEFKGLVASKPGKMYAALL
jgi:DNA processing protein